MSLKKLAEYLALSPATVSLVINRSSVADSIPQETKDRIFTAVRKFKYRPNFFARSLRTQRSFTIGVIVPEVSDGYSASVMSGVEDYLLNEGYFYFVASHRHRADLIDEYPRMFLERSVDGLIAVDTPWHLNLSVGRHEHRAQSPEGGGARAEAPAQSGTSPNRFYQGAGIQFGHGSALEQHRAGCETARSADESKSGDATAGGFAVAGTGAPRRQDSVGLGRAVYGALCVQRHLGDGSDTGVAGGGATGSRRRFSSRI